MQSKKISKIPPAKLALYEQLIATHPGIERKGDVHPYTSANSHMFSRSDRKDGAASAQGRIGGFPEEI